MLFPVGLFLNVRITHKELCSPALGTLAVMVTGAGTVNAAKAS